MGIFPRPNPFFLLSIICLSTVLAACSSGGGGGKTKDTRPDPFALSVPSDVTTEDVAYEASIVSEPFTVTGLEAAAPISVENGEYAIDDGEFTSVPGSVSNGQQVRVRMKSSVKGGQSKTATVNIGGETASMTTTTAPDTVPPEISILFPPPASMTDGQTLFVRGTVKDVNGTLAEGAVTVNGVEADLALNQAGDEATWSVTVDLALGENAITVTAVDVEENISEGESVNSRRVASIAGQSFPDNTVPFSGPISLDIHEIDGKPVALVTDRPALAVISVDLRTGKRRVFSNNATQVDYPFGYPWNIHVGKNGKTYVFDWVSERPRIYELDSTGKRELFLQADESEESINQPFGMYLMGAATGEHLYLADGGRTLKVELQTKDKTVISDSINGIPDTRNTISGALDMAFSAMTEQLIVIGAVGNNAIYYVHPQTGVRSKIEIDGSLAITNGAVLGDGKYFVAVEYTKDRISIIDLASGSVTLIAGAELDVTNLFQEPREVVVSHNQAYLLVIDRVLKSIIALDLESYQQVVVTKSE
jgi:hypothetical protein